MGSSFTELDGHGFWARYSNIELRLYLLTEEIDHLDDLPTSLPDALETDLYERYGLTFRLSDNFVAN